MRLMKAFPLNVLAILAGALLCSTALLAQHSTATPRIVANVNELSLTTLRGNVPSLARAEYDQGEASSSTQLTHIRLVLSRSPEQQAALDQYAADLQDKSSPNYHKWLTPEQFGQLYGPADSDVAALVAWVESQGLTMEPLSPGRTNIAFSGSVRQVEEAFHTSIHSFQAGERQFYSNTTEPQIPAALIPVVNGVAHLNTIQPRPYLHSASAGQFNPETRRLEPLNATADNAVRPGLTLTSSGAYTFYMVPGDAATVYDTPNTTFNANYTSGTSYTGTGVKIGIGGDATILASVVGNYRSLFLGSATSVTLNYCTSYSSCSGNPGSGYVSGDADEAYLDTELSGGLAPGATIYYYASPDLYTGIEAAINANVVDIFSLSFGECEQNMSTSDNALINGWWQQAANQGIAVTVSTGDSGSASCDGDNANPPKYAKLGLSVSGFASTPYNIAVGGTDYYSLINAFSTYVSTSQGASATYYRTALGYIPESVWNDSTYFDDVPLSQNVPWSGEGYSSRYNNIVAGGGGFSSCSTNTSTDNSNGSVNVGSCTSGYNKPAWQTGTGVPADGKRDLPDVSLMSGNGYDNATWLVCTNDAAGSGTSNCAAQSGGTFYFQGFGGTSTAAPAFAGILALVQQKANSRLGQAAAELYSLYNGSNASQIFHDVTVGNNSVSCTSSTPNCLLNSVGYYYESGYNAVSGYDMATGLGSVDVKNLVNYWSGATGSAAATINVTSVSPNPVTTAQSLSVAVSVTGGSGTPTGTVTLSGGGYASNAQTLVGGAYTFNVPAGSMAIGADTLTITYSGDSTYARTTNSSTTVQVNGLPATVNVNHSPASINSNQQLTVSGTVTGTDGTPTGTVTLTGGGYTSTAQTLVGGAYSFTIPYNSLSGGNDTLSVTYSGNTIYVSEVGTTSVTVTYITALTPSVTVTPASGAIDSAQSLNVTVAVTGSGALPTGTIILSGGGYTSATETIGTSPCTSNTNCVFSIPANRLNSTTDTLTASYSGDPNYYAGTGSNTVTVTQSVYSLVATTPASIAPGASTTSTITVSSTTLYSGTVTLTCLLTTSPTGAAYAPSCSSGSTVTMSSGVASGTATITVNTTAARAALAYPRLPGRGWSGAGGGAVLAFLLFLGIPARRRSWRSMLIVLIMMAALGSLAACGGGGSMGGGSTGTSGTSPGTYTFTVTGTGNPTVTPAPTTTFTVTVT
jgi:subtilase family serine protease